MSDNLYLKCETEGCDTFEAVYAGQAYAYEFPETWKDVVIPATCLKCSESEKP